MLKNLCHLSPKFMFIYYTYIRIVLILDAGVFAATLSEIISKKGLGLSSIEAGTLGSCPLFFNMLFASFFAYLSQRFHSEYLIAIGLLIANGGMVLTAYSTNFITLLFARVLKAAGRSAFDSLSIPCIIERAPSELKNM